MLGSSGVGVYLEGCLSFFLDTPHNFILFGDEKKISSLTKGKKNIVITGCEIKPFSPAELFAFPGSLLKQINQSDLYYSPYFNVPGGITVPIFLTIHDIIFPDMPGLVSFPGLQARMFFYRRSFRRADTIFTVSDFSKSRIEYHLGKKKKIINASTAVNTSYIDTGIKTKPEDVTKKKSILFIGNIKKHKGLGLLLDAFLNARKDGLDYHLVIIGSKDNFRSGDSESAERLENIDENSIRFTGFIPESEKWRLLAESALLVQPSLYEGFGTPPLEAMLAGTPALVSDIPVFREVYNDFPVTFFTAGDSGDLKAKMMELLYNKDPLPLVLSPSLKEKYSFKKTGKTILEIFDQINLA